MKYFISETAESHVPAGVFACTLEVKLREDLAVPAFVRVCAGGSTWELARQAAYERLAEELVYTLK